MACFSDLPNELVLAVHDNLDPSDLKNFYCLDKHTYSLTAIDQLEHRRLRRKYTIPPNTGILGSTAILVRNILKYPRAALYVREWKIDFYRTGGWGKEYDDDDEITNHIRYPEDDMALYEAAIRVSMYVPGPEKDEWIASMRNGDEDVLFALAVTLVPNLRAVEFGNQWEYYGRVAEVLRNIGYPLLKSSAPFSQLTTITIQPEAGGDYIDLDAIEAFASLPSVKVLNIHRSYASGDNLELIKALRGSNVTDVNISDSDIPVQRLAVLLDNFDNLQSFSYWPGGDAAMESVFQPFFIIKILLSCAQHSLRELNIRQGMSTNSTYMGSLYKFSVLESLEAELPLFIGDSTYAADAIRRFTRSFPLSLRTIKLIARDEQRYQYASMLEGLVRYKKERMPNLTRVELVNTGLRPQDMRTWQAKCERVGVSLILTKQYPVVLPVFTNRRTHFAERQAMNIKQHIPEGLDEKLMC